MASSDDGGPVEFPRFEAGPASPTSTTSSASSPTDLASSTASTSHRRTISGSSFLARLPFLRTDSRSGDGASSSPISPDGVNNNSGKATLSAAASRSARDGQSLSANASPTSPSKKQPSFPQAPPSVGVGRIKGRSRKGSLRKAALLSTGRVRLDRKGLGLETIASPRLEHPNGDSYGPLSPEVDDYPTPRASYDYRSREIAERDGFYGHAHQTNNGHEGWLNGRESSDSQDRQSARKQHTSSEENLSSKPARASRLARRDVSTTDEDDASEPGRLNDGSSGGTASKSEHDASYFSAKPGILRHRASKNAVSSGTAVGGGAASGKASPLGTMAMDTAAIAQQPAMEEWDYAATEWWGWVILILTWAVFVVGMGSCFGVWSWAWDVGETPYAPPELEDDATLPIVGYYPALIILTAVMAWIWVLVAWVGMKYFKHAKIPGEDV